ncbi:MAG: hypothetical protein AAFV43_09795 [Planctomycetota bacterium]
MIVTAWPLMMGALALCSLANAFPNEPTKPMATAIVLLVLLGVVVAGDFTWRLRIDHDGLQHLWLGIVNTFSVEQIEAGRLVYDSKKKELVDSKRMLLDPRRELWLSHMADDDRDVLIAWLTEHSAPRR